MAWLHGKIPGGTTAEVTRDIDLKILDFFRGYERFLNQNIKKKKFVHAPVWLLNGIAQFLKIKLIMCPQDTNTTGKQKVIKRIRFASLLDSFN